MDDELIKIYRALPRRLRASLKAQVYAVKNYADASDTDVARDLNVIPETVRNHRRDIAAYGLLLPPLRSRGQPRKLRCPRRVA
jgi:hypothetical protein